MGSRDEIDLERVLSVPKWLDDSRHKCRVVYGENILHIEYQRYLPRPIHSLMLVRGDSIEYSYKYENRAALDSHIEMRGDCDDVLIVRNGRLTDTSYANIALFDGCRWVTPSTFLLSGTMRRSLIDRGMITIADIGIEDLHRYKKLCLINAMLDLGEIEIPVENIKK